MTRYRKPNIIQYYKKNVNDYNSNTEYDLLKQVGKTYLGVPIKPKILKIIINTIIRNLDISKKDNIIDLGCANGLLSEHISKVSNTIYGFDISSDLINIAIKNSTSNNIKYIYSDILKINFCDYLSDKIYMYEVLQHLKPNNLISLLSKIIREKKTFKLFIGSIPDTEKLFNFYNTNERKKYYLNDILNKNSFHIGSWWYRDQLSYICEDLDLDCKIIEQNKSLHTSHYRFDCLIKKK